jgi:pilus assembly protein CpaF
MFTVTITEKGGNVTVRDFDQPEVTIGRIQGNDVVLPKSNISKRHARIVNSAGSFVVIDSKSTNGTYINGKRIDAPYDLRVGDKIFVGDFTLEVESQPSRSKSQPPPPPPEEPAHSEENEEILADDEWGAGADLEKDWADDWGEENDDGTAPARDDEVQPEIASESRDQATEEPAALGAPAPEDNLRTTDKRETIEEKQRPQKREHGPAEMTDEYSLALRRVHERLLRSLDLRRMEIDRMDDDELRSRTREAVREIVDSMQTDGEVPHGVDAGTLIDNVLDEALGLGPIEDLLHDDTVTEILVNNAQQIYVERQGRLELTDRSFSSDQAVFGVIERIVAPIGRRIDESSPMVDARLKDGSRVNAIIPPLSLKGPTLTIRKFTREPLQVDDLVGLGTLTPGMAEFLEVCVEARRNILISGGTGSGKTTTLNVLSGYIPENERIITIEDAAELKLDQNHVVSLEARPPNIEGRGAITIRELVRNALRMRPDRIVVGECRGGEALDMLQAMNTGHEGSLTTVHANAPRDALARLETMVLMSGMDLPVRAIREQIASAINVIVQQARLSDGTRRVTAISEVTGMEGEVISMQDIFEFAQEGFDANGRAQGRHRPTGFVPKFYEDLKARGIEANMAIFQE